MQQIYIPRERLKKLRSDSKALHSLARCSRCKISIDDDETVEVEGDAYDEFAARGVIQAYGRGFDAEQACLLSGDEYYLKIIDLEELFGKSRRIRQVKARVIGENGRSKKYIEEVSHAHLSVYGNTVSIIGRIDEVSEAEIAIETLLTGGTHKLAYSKMEAVHRRNRSAARDARF